MFVNFLKEGNFFDSLVVIMLICLDYSYMCIKTFETSIRTSLE